MGYLVTYFEMSKVTAGARWRRRPVTCIWETPSRTSSNTESGRGAPGCPGRLQVAAQKPGGSLPDHERGTLASRSPQRRKLDTRGGQRGIREFSPSGPFGTEAAGPIGGLARASPARLAGCSAPLFWGVGGSGWRRRGRRTQGTSAGTGGRGRGRRQRRRLQAAPTPASAAPAAPSRPAVLSPPNPSPALSAGLCLPNPGAEPL